MTALAEQYYQEGIKSLQQGVFTMAEEMFRKATQEEPSKFEFWNLLGLSCQFQKKWPECDRSWREALRCKPDSIDTKLNLGIANIALGNEEAAEQFWLSILNVDPKHVQSLINLGLFYRERKQNLLAHKMWTDAFEVVPQNAKLQEWIADVKGVIGMVHLSNRDFHTAEAFLKEAVVMDPEYDVLWGYLAEWHFQKKEFKQAFATCSKGLNLNPQNPTMHHTMGNILRMTGQEDEALNAYHRALELGSRHPATYRAIAELEQLEVDEDEHVIQQLFDQYADSFDTDVQENLGYKTPTIAFEVYRKSCPDYQPKSILDLGCGTGLSIEPFFSPNIDIIGVDISQSMLTKAQSKNLYSELHRASMKEYLQEQTRLFDLVLCLDALIYIRNLGDIFQEVYRATHHSGMFIFSTEQNKSETPLLQSSGRYSHPKAFLEALLLETKWHLISVTDAQIRKDGDRWIKGNIWIVQKK